MEKFKQNWTNKSQNSEIEYCPVLPKPPLVDWDSCVCVCVHVSVQVVCRGSGEREEHLLLCGEMDVRARHHHIHIPSERETLLFLQETPLSFIPQPCVTLPQWRLMADGSDFVCPAWNGLLSPLFNKVRAPLEELRNFCPSSAPSPQHYLPSLINSEGWHCLSRLVFALNFIEMGHWKLITSCLDSDFDFCSAASKINSSWR